MSEICWRRVTLEQAVALIPWSTKLFKYCSAAVGKEKEVRGWRQKEKCEMTSAKVKG
jgi:hypothetical protein